MSSINASFVNEEAAASASKGLRIEGVLPIWPGAVLHRFFKRADTRDAKLIASPCYSMCAAASFPDLLMDLLRVSNHTIRSSFLPTPDDQQPRPISIFL